ncbi:MAG: LicD family protein [Lachnospiraceae bacterium]|nr:LicD family protein [Lachnospiraceae bacterium]
MDYEKEVLRKLQLTELEMLKDIDRFCKEYQIEYFIAYGTALGAVRHGGFIPWDDDIDICMKRTEYNKFLKLAKKNMKEKYDILTIQETPGYISTFAKVSKKGTRFVEETNTNKKYQQGIFIDVFPYDYAPDDINQRKKIFKKAWLWVRVCMLCEISNPIIPQNIKGLKRTIAITGCKAVHLFLKIIRFDKKKAYHHYLEYATMYNKKGGEIYLSDYEDISPERTTLLETDIFPTKTIQFEDYEFPIPNNIDAHLKKVYGDYMTLPPIEQRHNHVAKVLIFGDEN